MPKVGLLQEEKIMSLRITGLSPIMRITELGFLFFRILNMELTIKLISTSSIMGGSNSV